jgi:hypothetical protein
MSRHSGVLLPSLLMVQVKPVQALPLLSRLSQQ